MPDIGHRHLDSRRRRGLGRFAAATIGLGLLVVFVPDEASSRRATVAGLLALAAVAAAVSLVRSTASKKSGAVRRTPVAVAVVPVAVVPDPAVPVAVVPVDDHAERLAMLGDVLSELFAASASHATRPPARPALDDPAAAVPRQRGPVNPEPDRARGPARAEHWEPQDAVGAAAPILHAGWPFVARDSESAETEQSAGSA